MEWLQATGAAGSEQRGLKSRRSQGCVGRWLKATDSEQPMGATRRCRRGGVTIKDAASQRGVCEPA